MPWQVYQPKGFGDAASDAFNQLTGATRVLSNRDMIALSLSAGYKIAGGHWLEAFMLGLFVRVVMHEINWPMLLPATQEAVTFARTMGPSVGQTQDSGEFFFDG